MPYAPHHRITLIADFSAGDGQQAWEIAVTGFSVDRVTIADPEFADIVTACSDFWQRGSSGIPSVCRLIEVKDTHVDAQGHAINPIITYTYSTPVHAVGSSNKPTFNCTVATLESSATGVLRRKRGRMFIPSGLDCSAGRISNADRDGVRDSVATLLSDVNDALGDRRVCTASRTAATNYPVTSVTADNIPDYLSSRKKQLVGARSAQQPVSDGT